eukprot:755459-Alexandrium_andersonii.AAC.1
MLEGRCVLARGSPVRIQACDKARARVGVLWPGASFCWRSELVPPKLQTCFRHSELAYRPSSRIS